MPEIIVIEPMQNPCTRPKRVAAYCRVSSDSEDQLHSYYAQVRYYTDQLAQMKDAVSAGIYADEGITGTEMRKRSEFLRLIEDCRRGKIDRIVTKSISRFARNTLESLETARTLKALGISIYFEEDHLDTATMSSEAILTLKSAAAQAGSQSISKNVKMGKRMKMKNGTFVTNMVPFGYRYMEREAVPDPKQAEIVRRIFREYKNGSGAHVIAKRLNAEEIPSTDGGRWHESHITRILGNPYYTGVMVMQKTYRTDAFPYVQKKNYGEQQWYCKYRAQEAIIDWQEFQLVQEILAARREQHRRPPSAAEKPPLWQKVICGVCGHTYNRRVNSTGHAAWVCLCHRSNARTHRAIKTVLCVRFS